MDILNTIISQVAVSQQFIANCPACFYNMKVFFLGKKKIKN